MSGQEFVEALLRLGYPKASQLDGASFDWAFEYSAMAPFLQWFSTEIQANNRLHPKDVKEFHDLSQRGEVVLEGEQLEEALHNLVGDDGQEDLTEAAILEDIRQLEEDLDCVEHRKQLIIQQRDSISHHKTYLEDRLLKLTPVEEAANIEYKTSIEHSQQDNSKMNTSLGNLVTSVTSLNNLYKEIAKETKPYSMESGGVVAPKSAVFLSQVDLEKYFNMEEKFTTELTNFTKKQFFEGVAEMAGADEGSRYEILEISNPDTLLVAGEKESTVYEACKEVARLQMHYPKSESLRVNALIEEKTTSTACDFNEQKLKQLKQKPYPKNRTELNIRLKDSQNKLSLLRRDLHSLGEDEIPRLITDSATLQVTWVLRGNYDLKIARQDYFMSNQQQVISELLKQKARYEFLVMAYELEAKGHRDTYHLLTAITILLQDMAQAYRDRMEMLADPLLTTSRNQRNTLDSRDKFFTKLHQLLDPSGLSDKQQLFITYNELADNSDRLHNQLGGLRTAYSTMNNNQDDRIRTLEKCVNQCERILYSDSTTLGGEPILSPQPIIDTLTQLESLLKQLEKAVLDIINNIKNKKKTLENDHLLVVERELYVYFLNRPDKLRHVVQEITDRVNAQQVT